MTSKREETRKRMVDAAGRGFRAHGYAGVGVDSLAKGAGVTSGAFYAHFGSKDAAFEAALAKGLDEVLEGVTRFQSENGADWLKAFADYYLSPEHRSDLACGCAMATLTPDVVRAGAPLNGLFEDRMKRIVSLIANGLRDGEAEGRTRRAWAVITGLVGGLTFARAVADRETSDLIAESARAAALAIAGATKDPSA
ncbi:TetR/AcrR family transcriptional regulator [Roseibium aggregatum]|uniref:TetR/AcrR family transcriptional regulator n=1 Tax=Roseibium aggregatum TaxID=187304 RepID=A0A926P4P9_9HYPH|nr:TetR/AcrR family transcriptional regulator [Roseibium aggregatum]MBD1549463.1 TetR/AcrR family transcriptional regulator [Roseibium aggregatum]